MTEPAKIRIVVADDDQDVLDLVVFKLTQAGYDAVPVGDGVAALAAIEAELPRLAILDVMMPGLSGLDVLRALRASEATKDLDVILSDRARPRCRRGHRVRLWRERLRHQAVQPARADASSQRCAREGQ